MHAVYTYKPTATQQQVLRDIILILTGTTSPASLSASCDTAATTIDSTRTGVGNNNDYDPGASSGTSQAFRMSAFDEPTTYTYVYFTIAASTISLGMATGWSTGTHTASAPNGVTTTIPIPTVGTTGGVLYIWTDGKSIVLNSSTNSSMPLHALQFTRDDAWRTTANGCFPMAAGASTTYETSGSSWIAGASFTLKSVNTTPAFVNAGTAYSNVYSFMADAPRGVTTPTQTLSSSLAPVSVLIPVRAGLNVAGGMRALGGSVTSVSEIYSCQTATMPGIGDLITYNSETYKCYGGYTNDRICIRVS